MQPEQSAIGNIGRQLAPEILVGPDGFDQAVAADGGALAADDEIPSRGGAKSDIAPAASAPRKRH
jgi:hypothetical protein